MKEGKIPDCHPPPRLAKQTIHPEMSSKHPTHPKAPTPLEFEKPVAELEKMLADLKGRSEAHAVDLSGSIKGLEAKI